MFREIYKRIFNDTDKPIEGAVYWDEELKTCRICCEKPPTIQVAWEAVGCVIKDIDTSGFKEGDKLYLGSNTTLITLPWHKRILLKLKTKRYERNRNQTRARGR